MAGKSLSVEAAISSTLPMSVLLGTDVPLVADLVPEDALVVITRAQAKRQEQTLAYDKHKHDACGVRPQSLDTVEDISISDTEDDSKNEEPASDMSNSEEFDESISNAAIVSEEEVSQESDCSEESEW